MHENRNPMTGGAAEGRGMFCIDTRRVLDSCRDRDCFENARVYLTAYGEEILASANSVRTKSARTLWAYVGIEDVPFNCGFYQVTVRYYIEVEVEACIGIGRSQCIKGLAVLDKDVVLYGGEGYVTSFTSSDENTYCTIRDLNTMYTTEPFAVVETVEPVVLGTRIDYDCGCCTCCDCSDIPAGVASCFDGCLVSSAEGPRLLVSFGIFSVIRLERPAQLLISATDYSVPDKECTPAMGNDSPCDLFRTMSFPVARFKGNTCCTPVEETVKIGGCGCGKNK